MPRTTYQIETMAGDKRKTAAKALQAELVELLDLTLITKQLHWNVRGTHFRSVHLQLDDIFNDLRVWTDTVAERIVTLGVPAKGQTKDVAGSKVKPVPADFIEDHAAAVSMAEGLAASATNARLRAEKLGDVDLVSQSVLLEIIEGMEKHIWMLKAQLEGFR
jgi:starvation-inducible DNA-binding protein